jgi:hypothetical protein
VKVRGTLAKLGRVGGGLAATSVLILKEDGVALIVCMTAIVLVVLLNEKAFRRAKLLVKLLLTARPTRGPPSS